MVTTERVQNRGLSPYKPIPVTLELFQKVIGGDQDAYTRLHELLQPRFYRFFLRRVPQEAEDLTQDTLIAVVRNLDGLSFKQEDSFAEQFTRSCFGIAKKVLNGEMRRLAARKEIFSEVSLDWVQAKGLGDQVDRQSLKSEEEERGKIALKRWLSGHLSTMQNTVVIHSMKGKNLQEIAEVAGINKGQLRYEIRKARRIIEEDLLQPAGFCRITEFRDKSVEGLSKNALNQASVNGKLKVVKILGFYYTNKDNINEYLATRRDNVNESQLSEGYIFVGDHVTVAEYAVLRNHTGYRRELLAYVGNRAYIKNEDLEEFRKQRGTRTIKFDEDGNANLSDLAPTA